MFKDIDIKFVDKEITPFGGLSLFLKMVERCGFLPDPLKTRSAFQGIWNSLDHFSLPYRV